MKKLSLTDLEKISEVLSLTLPIDKQTITVIKEAITKGRSISGVKFSQDEIDNLKKNIRLLSERISYQSKRYNRIKREIYSTLYGSEQAKLQFDSNQKDKLLKDFINERAEAYNLKRGETVDVAIVKQILNDAQKNNLTKANTLEAIRKMLQRLGYSKERTPSYKSHKTDLLKQYPLANKKSFRE